MQITLTWQSVITAAAVLGAVAALIKYFAQGYDFVKRQKDQDREIQSIREELTLHTHGLLACLQGMKALGCDGPVTEAIDMIEENLNKKAHGQE